MTDEAARELDAEVAVRVMGWRLKGCWWEASDGSTQGCTLTDERWRPSVDIADAWRVVEHLRAEGWLITVKEMPDGYPYLGGDDIQLRQRSVCTGLWMHRLRPESRGRYYPGLLGVGDSAPLAICRAALEWAAWREKERGDGDR